MEHYLFEIITVDDGMIESRIISKEVNAVSPIGYGEFRKKNFCKTPSPQSHEWGILKQLLMFIFGSEGFFFNSQSIVWVL